MNIEITYHFLDVFFFICHCVLITFNMVGWIWRRTRWLHFWAVVVTAASWLLLGIWYGLGYCPLTEWHWQVKRELGETDLPNSFIKYFIDHVFNTSSSASLVDTLTGIGFSVAALLSVYYNFFHKPRKEKAV